MVLFVPKFRVLPFLAVALVVWFFLPSVGLAEEMEILVCGDGATIDEATRGKVLSALMRAGIGHGDVRSASGLFAVSVSDRHAEAAVAEIRGALATTLVVARGVSPVSGVPEALSRMLGALLGSSPAAGGYLLLEVDDALFADQEVAQSSALLDSVVRRAVAILRSRADRMGAESIGVERRGRRRIAVQVEGLTDPGRDLDLLAAATTVELHWVDNGQDPEQALASGRLRAGSRLYADSDGIPVILEEAVIVGGEHVADAVSGIDQRTGQPVLYVSLDTEGAERMVAATRNGIGRPIAVLLIGRDASGQSVEKVISVAVVREALGKRFMVSGLEDERVAGDLALLLGSGVLPASLTTIESCAWAAEAPVGSNE